jgi:hypothetical protein
MLSTAPFWGLSAEGSSRKASKGEMDVKHRSATQWSRLLIQSLARGLRRVGEMNLWQELMRPVVREGS